MMRPVHPAILTFLLWSTATLLRAEEPLLYQGWTVRSLAGNVRLHTRELEISPAIEPRRIRAYRFLPSRWEQQDGNAAVCYLKAMGFLELDQSRHRLREIEQRAIRQAEKVDGPISQQPPFVWQEQSPGDLPLEKVRQFVSLGDFQRPLLAQAWRQRSCDFHHDLRDSDDPYEFPLSDIQMTRDLGRFQLLRCKLAIAERRYADAVREIGYQFALAKHVGTDPIVVSRLVGQWHEMAAYQATLDLIGEPESPNLYWALATLPTPLIPVHGALEFERELIFQYVPLLKEVNDKPKPAEYWRRFLVRSTPGYQRIGRLLLGDSEVPDDPDEARLAFASAVISAYPPARRYLVEQMGMPRAQVDKLPAIQAVLLAWLDRAAVAADVAEATAAVPYWRAGNVTTRGHIAEEDSRREWLTLFIGVLPTGAAVSQAATATAQVRAMIETVEAIRDQAARNGGTLPQTLDELTLKPPYDPATGRPFEYHLEGNRALLSSATVGSNKHRIILRLRKE